MYLRIVLFIVFLGSFASTQEFEKKARSDFDKWFNIEEKLDLLRKEETDLQAELERELEAQNEVEDFEEDHEEPEDYPGKVEDIIDFTSMTDLDYANDEAPEDPCTNKYCEAGRECVITEESEAVCQCVSSCDYNDDERRKVCSNYNTTWSSDCELYRMRCLCSEDDESCRNSTLEHMHIDYYGSCQVVQNCEEEELNDFPRRMREWLFNIMTDMTEEPEDDEETGSAEDEKHQWMKAAVWKWCQLDNEPRDKSVSRHEIFPVRAPLYTLEHCISPFLDSCDPDDDHYITLKEWSNCLELSEELTEDMQDMCEEIRTV